MKAGFAILLIVSLCFAAQAAFAWTSVGDGIEYQYFLDSGPNDVFVCRMARANTNATIESCSAYGKTIGGREVMSAQGARCDQAIGFWGQSWGSRNSVICTINGDYEDANDPSGVMLEGMVHSGWYDKQYGIPTCGGVGFGWSLNRVPSMPDTASITAAKQLVTYTATAVSQQFQGINRARGSNELIIYTPQYDSNTHADNTGAEVVVRMQRPALILPTPSKALGNVIEIRQAMTGANIPFDCVVLSATGGAASQMLGNVSIGAELGISQEVTFWDKTCATSAGIDWTKMYASVGGNVRFLRNGVIEHNYQAGMIVRNPRTAICYNATYVFFVVCDGRSGRSVGWTNDEMATFCLNSLAATDGVNQDGGGSSDMVVNGTVMNSPSDGSERAVVNGIMMVNIQPKQQNTTFVAGQQVATTGVANVRLGPGTNYASLGTVNSGTTGTVLTASLNGVSAKNDHWWNVNFPTLTGWVAESLIGGSSCTNVAITTQPGNQTVTAGQTATFTVAASGTPPLSYQWQKNGVNLNNGGNISGATTATLSVSNCQTTDQGNYCCVVSNSCPSSATSNNATLTVNPGCTNVAITAQPQNQTVATGATATFTVGASGTAPLSYQWQKNSVNLNNGGNISGATTATLSVSNCQTADQGNYCCVVSNSCPSSATSNNATLTVSGGGGGTTVILDEDQGTWSGSWTPSTCQANQAYNGDYKYASSASTETAWYKWTPNLTGAGNYDVYVMYRSGGNRTIKAPYTIYYNGGSQTYQVNQTANGGTWVLLGRKAFLAGTTGYVRLSNNTGESGKAVVADAIKWVPAP